MASIKKWWSNQWAKNLVFFGILSLLFFTDLGTWISIQFTKLTLDEPAYIEFSPEAESLYQYDIRMVDAQDSETALRQFEGEFVFLNMWASWCVPCMAEFTGLKDLQSAVPGLRMVVLNIEEAAPFEQYMQKNKYDLPFYRVVTPLPHGLTAPALPASYIIDEEGRVVYHYLGAADWSDPMVISRLKALMH